MTLLKTFRGGVKHLFESFGPHDALAILAAFCQGRAAFLVQPHIYKNKILGFFDFSDTIDLRMQPGSVVTGIFCSIIAENVPRMFFEVIIYANADNFPLPQGERGVETASRRPLALHGRGQVNQAFLKLPVHFAST